MHETFGEGEFFEFDDPPRDPKLPRQSPYSQPDTFSDAVFVSFTFYPGRDDPSKENGETN